MSDLIKKIKIKKQDGTFTDYIPIGAEAQNVSTSDGDSVQLKLNKKPYYYDTVADMKADTKLKVGDMAITLGYYEVNDGGNATYIIIENTATNILYETLANNLYAKLIINNKTINIKQVGAYGDYTHDDYDVFNKVFNFICRDTIYDTNISTSYIMKYTLDIPNGIYLIKKSNVLEGIPTGGKFGLIINGNKSRLLFDDFEGYGFHINNTLADLEFRDITFQSSNDVKSETRTLFYSYSTGQTQNLRFIDCSFNKKWKYIFHLYGSNNNSEFLFNNCSMSGSWDAFLYDNESNSSDQFVNYWFTNCRYWCSSPWIDIKKGGHIKLNNCDISGYQPSEDTYLYSFGVGSVAQGVSVFIDEGSRYELKTSHAKVLKSRWDNGLIHFNNVDFSSQSQNEQIEKCFYINTATNYDIIRFSNSKIYGKFYLETYANANISTDVVLENCLLTKPIDNLVEFATQFTYTPSLRLINCHAYDNSHTHYNTLLRYNNNLYNRNVLQKTVYSYNPSGSIKSTLKTYFKPYYIESVAFGKQHWTYDNDTTIKVKCLLGTITAVNSSTNITVSSSDFSHFVKDMPIEINGVANTVSYNNLGSYTITLTTANSNMTVGDEIYIILFNHISNAYFGQATYKETMHWKLYNDLLYEASAPTIGELIYEIIE